MEIIKKIFHNFSKKERLAFITAFLLFLVSFTLSSIKFIETTTVLSPVSGGEFSEGIVGQPVFINPVLSNATDPSNDVNQLVFADLKNLLETYEISNDKKIFTIRVKGGLKWQDGQPLTTDDIIFTIEAIQDPNTNSPLLPNWKGVKMERTSEREMKLALPRPYVYFENIMTSLRPIPKHIFASIPFAHMKLSDYNIEPIGSGYFNFVSYSKNRDGFISEISLEKNKSFPGTKAYISKFNFKFYYTEDEALKAFNRGEIDGLAMTNPKSISKIYAPHQVFEMNMKSYYAIFINSSNNPILKDQRVRAALDYATDKQKLIGEIFDGHASPINGPSLLSLEKNDFSDEFSIDKANELLDNAGWQLSENGIREMKSKNGNQLMEVNLTVYPLPFLTDTAKKLQEDWKKIGVKTNLNIPSPSNFEENVIKNRDYDLLAFGNMYGENIDLFSFWHSSQKFYPGVNLSLYDNKNVDSLIELAKIDFDSEKRLEELNNLENIIASDQPAIFLYSPKYLYVSSKSLGGFDKKTIGLPSNRFSDIQNWYVKTARVLK